MKQNKNIILTIPRKRFFQEFSFLCGSLRFFAVLCAAVFFLTLLATPTGNAAPATEAYTPLPPTQLEPLLAKISARLGAVRSFEADFVQERHLAMFIDVLAARGVCAFENPDKFRWELREPYRSLLIFNHDQVAKFELNAGAPSPVQGGAMKVMRQLLGQMTGLMRGDFKASREAFDLSAAVGRDYRLTLTPRVRQMAEYIRAIEMSIGKDSLQVTRLVIREPEEDYIEIRFSTVRENIPLAPGLFDTNHPTLAAAHDEPHK